ATGLGAARDDAVIEAVEQLAKHAQSGARALKDALASVLASVGDGAVDLVPAEVRSAINEAGTKALDVGAKTFAAPLRASCKKPGVAATEKTFGDFVKRVGKCVASAAATGLGAARDDAVLEAVEQLAKNAQSGARALKDALASVLASVGDGAVDLVPAEVR